MSDLEELRAPRPGGDDGELRSTVFALTAAGTFVLWLTLIVVGVSVTAVTIALLVVLGVVGVAMLTLPLWRPTSRRPRHAGR